MMQMSHPWMYDDRRITAYREGVHSFRDAAEANTHAPKVISIILALYQSLSMIF
jgi:hypothetical protein